MFRESVFGGEEAYNSKLQPLDTYWQLNLVAELNQTYATMDRASPKCAHRSLFIAQTVPSYVSSTTLHSELLPPQKDTLFLLVVLPSFGCIL